jgi:hypothetical protein
LVARRGPTGVLAAARSFPLALVNQDLPAPGKWMTSYV